jgi:uridine phosphorylase
MTIEHDQWLTTRYLRLPDGTFPHLGVREGDVAPVVLLSGSPERVEKLAGMLDSCGKVGDRRGYSVFTGTYRGSSVSVATSGLGSPSVSIAVEELGACGARTFIRVGSCASISPKVPVGGVAIAHAAVSDEGTSRYYAPVNYPPVASPRVVQALTAAAGEMGLDVAVGLTRSTDSFYEGERTVAIIDEWRTKGVLTFEMETSCLFTVAGVLGWDAGSILCAGSNLLTGEATYKGDCVEAFAAGEAAMLTISLAAAAAVVG